MLGDLMALLGSIAFGVLAGALASASIENQRAGFGLDWFGWSTAAGALATAVLLASGDPLRAGALTLLALALGFVPHAQRARYRRAEVARLVRAHEDTIASEWAARIQARRRCVLVTPQAGRPSPN